MKFFMGSVPACGLISAESGQIKAVVLKSASNGQNAVCTNALTPVEDILACLLCNCSTKGGVETEEEQGRGGQGGGRVVI